MTVAASRRGLILTALAIGLCLFLVLSTRQLWLREAGRLLVFEQAPVKAEAIVVLAGDIRGNRILRACELAGEGWAPLVLVSGPLDYYGRNEADLAISFAVARGCPPSLLQPSFAKAYSTEEEARQFDAELIRRKIHHILIVTSNFHTARSGRIFRKQFQNRIQFQMVSASDEFFTVDGWWRTREGQKTTFFEYSKTIAGAVGL